MDHSLHIQQRTMQVLSVLLSMRSCLSVLTGLLQDVARRAVTCLGVAAPQGAR
jgi:hypothetical protein